jgi:hypothetical protein
VSCPCSLYDIPFFIRLKFFNNIQQEILVSESAGTGIPWLDVLVAILGAGGVAAALTALFDYFKGKREERYEMTKQKLEVISKSLPIYVQLVSIYSTVGSLLSQYPRDEKYCLYSICRLLLLQKSIYDTYGSLQLDDLDAETVVNDLGTEIISVIIKRFGREKMTKMRSLVDYNADYVTFLRNLERDVQLFNTFHLWLLEVTSKFPLPDDFLKGLANKCQWYSELTLFEINHIYRYWYNEEPRYHGLSEEVIKYLYTGYEDDEEYKEAKKGDPKKANEIKVRYTNYYNRIKSFETQRPLRRKLRKIKD